MFRRTVDGRFAIILVLILTAPNVLANGQGGNGGEGGASQRAGSHDGRIPQDLRTANCTNITFEAGGGARLGPGPDYIAGPITTVEATPNQNFGPVVAMNSKSESIVAWTSSGFDSNIYARRFDQNGSKLGPDIPVASEMYYESSPSIAVWPDDRFIIAWADFRAAYYDGNIYAQIYDRSGNMQGPQLDIVEDIIDQRMPVVAILPDSGFVVSWWEAREDQVKFQRYDSYAGKVGDEVMALRAAGIRHYAMATNPDGDIAIALVCMIGSPGPTSLAARFFPHDGGSNGTEVVLVPSRDEFITLPSITAGSGGDFLVAWGDGSENSTARWLAPDGRILGTNLSFAGTYPVVAALSTGGFIAATLEDWKNVSLQRFDRDGNRAGPGWSMGAGYPGMLSTAIAVGPDDRLAVFWKKVLDMVSDELDLCLCTRPYIPLGRLETADLSAMDLVAWTDVAVNATCPNASANTISLSFSTDGGLGWSAVPANLSLAAAGRAPALRLRAELATSDPKTSPVLHSLSAGFIADRAPSVAVIQMLTMWAGAQVTEIADGSDPDGDALTYRWTQTAGPDLGINGTENASIPVDPIVAGNCTLSVVASDGWLFSAPASMYVVVLARPPVVLSVRVKQDSPVYEVRLEASVPGGGGPAINGYNFDFGDNSTSGWVSASNLTHAYARDGRYRASVTVQYDDGRTSTSEPVTVTARKRVAEPSLLPLLALVALVVAGLVLALAVWRRKRQVTVIQYQPPPASYVQPRQPAPAHQGPPSGVLQAAPPPPARPPLQPPPAVPPPQG